MSSSYILSTNFLTVSLLRSSRLMYYTKTRQETVVKNENGFVYRSTLKFFWFNIFTIWKIADDFISSRYV